MVVLETCQLGGRKGAVLLLPYARITERKRLQYCARSEMRGCKN